MKKTIVSFIIAIVALAMSANAQFDPRTGQPLLPQAPQVMKPTFIKGDMTIVYGTHDPRNPKNSEGNPIGQKGQFDTYTMNINVCNSAIFRGTVVQTPFVAGGWVAAEQTSILTYNMNCDIVNPDVPSQVIKAGKIFGMVPIDRDGVYRYDSGNLTVSVEQIRRAMAFQSKFAGEVAGKPPIKPLGMVDSLKQSVVNIQKSVHGKTVIIAVKNYDKLSFKSAVVAAGPVQSYPAITINGDMLYDGDRYVWYFENLMIMYNDGQAPDRLTGNIRWVEDPARESNGQGEYQFDIRVNEPPPNESSAFAAPDKDAEASFFTVDNSVAGLTGTMKYVDSFAGKGNVKSSIVKIDLTGNRLTKQQCMSLCKLIVFESVVPFNSE